MYQTKMASIFFGEEKLFTQFYLSLKHNTGKENKARERNLKEQNDGKLVIKGYLMREREGGGGL